MDLTVHGLWTENFTAPWPASRCPVPRSPSITGIFALHWPHVFQRLQVHGDAHNEWFWGEGWRFHGGCSEALDDQVGFFHLAVDLKDMHD
ncbi:hypothetical protein RHGRI_028621 [Rhododendron griersonianum]|uniref:Uncharacterized protein n=1 Tax=Rhododendron griersonianum TaxID=479676 RepID=A0AAV6IGE6_9ERIC|nr:hypothetical protein RHGRI_028621 [Rhododendron griersonianum]